MEYGSHSANSYVMHEPECKELGDWIMSHIKIFKNIFMSCDLNQNGYITREALLRQIHKRRIKIPRAILNFFINIP